MTKKNNNYRDKKIAFVIQGLGIGGAEKFLVAVINAFCANQYQAVLYLLTRNGQLLPELDSRVKVVTIVKRSRLDIWAGARLKSHIRSEGIRKVFCINSYAFFLARLFFYFDPSVRFYVSLHSTIPFSRKCFWQNMIYFRVLRQRDKVIYLCNSQKQYLKKKYYLLHRNDLVVYNGIDTAYFDPAIYSNAERNEWREKYQLSKDDEVIVLVARLQSEKRHTDAIAALSVLHNLYKHPAHLLFVGSGDGAFEQSLKKFAEDKGMAGFVHFAGAQQDVRKFYAIADLFTLTSNSETFSLSALEAMAFCLPCSLTDVGGAAEMMKQGVTGMLSRPEDPDYIAYTWNWLLLQHLKGERIRRYVLENFTSERMLQQYIDIVAR